MPILHAALILHVPAERVHQALMVACVEKGFIMMPKYCGSTCFDDDSYVRHMNNESSSTCTPVIL